MSKRHLITTLCDYTAWAFERVWTCVDRLTEEQFTQETGFSSGSIRNQYVHLVSANRRWIQRMQGVPASPRPAFADYPTIASVKTLWAEGIADLTAYVHSLDDAQLNEIVHWEIPDRGLSHNHHRWQIILHLFNHATDHRAQILSSMHHTFNAQTIEQDLIFFPGLEDDFER
jgi:uncharacterized damage-inducible protein DinB